MPTPASLPPALVAPGAVSHIRELELRIAGATGRSGITTSGAGGAGSVSGGNDESPAGISSAGRVSTDEIAGAPASIQSRISWISLLVIFPPGGMMFPKVCVSVIFCARIEFWMSFGMTVGALSPVVITAS